MPQKMPASCLPPCLFLLLSFFMVVSSVLSEACLRSIYREEEGMVAQAYTTPTQPLEQVQGRAERTDASLPIL